MFSITALEVNLLVSLNVVVAIMVVLKNYQIHLSHRKVILSFLAKVPQFLSGMQKYVNFYLKQQASTTIINEIS